MQTQPLSPCIYCGTLFDSAKGQGDHVIPSAFGEFDGDVRFRRCCSQCNNLIGRSEEQLIRCGTEAVVRRFVPINSTGSRKKRNQKPTRGRAGARGASAPQYLAREGDHHILVDPHANGQPGDVVPLEQLVLLGEDGKEHPIQLFPGMNAAAFTEKWEDLVGAQKWKSLWIHCDGQNMAHYLALIKGVAPSVRIEELPETPAGVHEREVKIQCTFTDHYFRALAKMALHYYLCHTGYGVRGDEDWLKPIRDFIMNGGDRSKFFTEEHRFVSQFTQTVNGQTMVPAQWRHALAANENGGNPTVTIWLFVGPKNIPRPWIIRLGNRNSALWIPKQAWAHQFLYQDSQGRTSKAGVVRKIDLLRIPQENIHRYLASLTPFPH